jgi:hypothetical protein
MRRETGRNLTAAAVRRAVEKTPRPTIRAGTVTQLVAADRTVQVRIDGDSLPSTCEVIGSTLLPINARVMVAFYPPHGAYVLGALGGAGGVAASDYGEVGGGANQDLTSAVFATYPTNASFTFTPPAAATSVILEWAMTGLARIGGRNQSAFRSASSLGPTGAANYTEGSGGGGVNPREFIGHRHLFTAGTGFTPGVPVTFTQEARRTVSPGFYRRDTLTRVSLIATWR